jgi:hypothetical protein
MYKKNFAIKMLKFKTQVIRPGFNICWQMIKDLNSHTTYSLLELC